MAPAPDETSLLNYSIISFWVKVKVSVESFRT